MPLGEELRVRFERRELRHGFRVDCIIGTSQLAAALQPIGDLRVGPHDRHVAVLHVPGAVVSFRGRVRMEGAYRIDGLRIGQRDCAQAVCTQVPVIIYIRTHPDSIPS